MQRNNLWIFSAGTNSLLKNVRPLRKQEPLKRFFFTREEHRFYINLDKNPL